VHSSLPYLQRGDDLAVALQLLGCDKQRNDYAKLRIIVRKITKPQVGVADVVLAAGRAGGAKHPWPPVGSGVRLGRAKRAESPCAYQELSPWTAAAGSRRGRGTGVPVAEAKVFEW